MSQPAYIVSGQEQARERLEHDDAKAIGKALGTGRTFLSRMREAVPAMFEDRVKILYSQTGLLYGRHAANEAAHRASEAITACRRHKIRLDADDDEIREAAKKWAGKVRANAHSEAHFAEYVGVEQASRPRMICERWWRRQLRRAVARDTEQAARLVGLVAQNTGCYASDLAVERRQQQQRRNKKTLSLMEATDGQVVLDMAGIVERSLANPRLRRIETMVRIGGAEDYADARGDVGLFITVTCPSRFHARTKAGRLYPSYDGSSPRDAQLYLRKIWARARARLAVAGIESYGLRVAEPHHDGCPHWHLLAFVPARQAEAFEAILWSQALRESGTEPGAGEHRFKCVRIDKSKGRAAGYVAKYVAKAIDGEGVDTDGHGNSGKTGARRAGAWAATWGIRQFQFWGMPKVGVWRELRRLGGAPAGPIGNAWAAADAGLWADFIRQQEQAEVGLLKDWSTAKTTYEEERGWVVKGVTFQELFVPTRLKSWVIQQKKTGLGLLGDLSITVNHNRMGNSRPKNTISSMPKTHGHNQGVPRPTINTQKGADDG